MLPAFLITFREVIEASLIVATILGILTKLHRGKSIKTVWMATGAASLLSVGLLVLGSLAGLKVQELYSGRTEELIEGILMIVSAGFITWAVFFLHNYFAAYKTHLLSKIKHTVENPNERKGLFILAFTAVFREGFEIVLFLSTIFLSDNPTSIFAGFAGGSIAGILVSIALFTATLRLPLYYAFKTTSVLLILFAAGLLAHGYHELAEAHIVPEFYKMTSVLLPNSGTFSYDIIKAIFGLRKSMDVVELILFTSYILIMNWWVFQRKSVSSQTS